MSDNQITRQQMADALMRHVCGNGVSVSLSEDEPAQEFTAAPKRPAGEQEQDAEERPARAAKAPKVAKERPEMLTAKELDDPDVEMLYRNALAAGQSVAHATRIARATYDAKRSER